VHLSSLRPQRWPKSERISIESGSKTNPAGVNRRAHGGLNVARHHGLKRVPSCIAVGAYTVAKVSHRAETILARARPSLLRANLAFSSLLDDVEFDFCNTPSEHSEIFGRRIR
jgi:hypothetical protein